MNISADARLATPAIAAWCALVIVLNLGGTDQNAIQIYAVWGCGAACVAAFFCIRRWPTVALACFVISVLLLILALRAPTHVDSVPWEQRDSESPEILQWADSLRTGMLEASRNFPSVGGQLLPGLAIGDTSNVSQSLLTSMKTASLTHITAVSGANCVIVTSSVIAITSRIGLSNRTRLVFAVLALIAFVILVTPQPSVVRAAVMATAVIIALFSGRPGTGMPLLSTAMMLILLWDPWWAIDYGFILSVSATIGLLVFSGPITTRLSRFMPDVLAAMIAIPLAAQIMCQPIIVLLAPQLPTYGIVANVLAGPAAPIATILGLIACLLLAFAQPLANLLLMLAWLPAEWVGQTAEICSKLPFSSIPWVGHGPGVFLAFVVSALILILLLGKSRKVRLLAGTGLTAGLLIVAIFGFYGSHLNSLAIPKDWSIIVCDVGQGDAILIRQQNEIALIDTGKDSTLLQACFTKAGIERINLLVLTHYDADHVGAVKALYGKVDTAVVGPATDERGAKIVRELNAGKTKIIHGTRGLSGNMGELHWSVLWPSGSHPQMNSGNPGSITLSVVSPEFTGIFLGDLGADAQNALLSQGPISPVDVVKVAHHGSADQSNDLYDKLNAKIAVLSVGANNSYGHPTNKTLDLLRKVGAHVLRTDKSGMLVISSGSSGFRLWSERGG